MIEPASTPPPAVTQRITAWLAASQNQKFPYDVDVLGHTFTVLQGVFSPRFYPETAFYAEHLLRRIRPSQTLLDIGCGIGVNAVLAALAGAEVTALDVNGAAVENTRLNALLHGVDHRVTAAVSDIFSAISPDPKFDTIYWNVPFTYTSTDARLNMLEEAIFDPGYRKNRQFLSTAPHFLAPDGEILMGVSETLGDMGAISRIAQESALGVEEIVRTDETGTPEPTYLQLLRLVPIRKGS